MSNRITEKDSLRIRTLTSTGLFTLQEIATDFEEKYSVDQISRHIKSKAPSLKGKLRRETSRGGVKLNAILSKIFPNVTIQEEIHVGDKLRLDFYVGAPYYMGFEFDGVQHKEYTPGLHKDREDFERGLEKDIRKEELCKGRGISLVRISHDDKMDQALVQKRIDKAGYGTGDIEKGFETGKEKYKVKQKECNRVVAEHKRKQYQDFKNSDSHKKNQEKQKEYRKQQYQKQKEWKKQNAR